MSSQEEEVSDQQSIESDNQQMKESYHSAQEEMDLD